MPTNEASEPETFGGAAGAELAACGLWQSAHSTCLGGLTGSSTGSWMPVVAVIGWTLVLLNSFWRSSAATLPLWQEKQFISSFTKFSKRGLVPAAWGAWQLSHAFAATVVLVPCG